MYRPLFILVEGPDDTRYVDRILKPLLAPAYGPINVTPYAGKAKRELQNFIKGAKKSCANSGGDYWFFHDKDEKSCITFVKEWLRDTKGIDYLDFSKMLIVVEEIEAWYLAGSDDLMRKYTIPHTNNITKEKFEVYSSREGHESRYECMLSVLKSYSLPSARQKNNSLAYCLIKLGT